MTGETSINGTDSHGPVKFGAFLGVCTPSVLTILGLIMYLRFGWVVGNVGLPLTIFIVLLANSITFITGLSASAIATNMKIGVGGEYYMISRSLGLAESIIVLAAAGQELPSYSVQVLAAAIIVVITILSGKSAAVALKLRVPVMIAIALSLIALIIGIFSAGLRAPEWTASYRTASHSAKSTSCRHSSAAPSMWRRPTDLRASSRTPSFLDGPSGANGWLPWCAQSSRMRKSV